MESTVPAGMQKTERSMQMVHLENLERRIANTKAELRALEEEAKPLRKALKGES